MKEIIRKKKKNLREFDGGGSSNDAVAEEFGYEWE